jgi:hypothetical protein
VATKRISNLSDLANCTDEEFDKWTSAVENFKGQLILDDLTFETKDVPGIEGKGNLSHKPHLAYLDPHLEHEMGMGMRYGAIKHGWNNHRRLGVEASQHILDSLKRHLNAYLRGEQIDTESNINHLACVMNNINFLYRLDRLYGYDAVMQNIYGETK